MRIRLQRMEQFSIKRQYDTENKQSQVIILSDTEIEPHPEQRGELKRKRRRQTTIMGSRAQKTSFESNEIEPESYDLPRVQQHESRSSGGNQFDDWIIPENQSESTQFQSNGTQLKKVDREPSASRPTVGDPFTCTSIEPIRPKKNMASYYKNNMRSLKEKESVSHFIEPPGARPKPVDCGNQVDGNLKVSIIDSSQSDGQISSTNQSILEMALIESVDQALNQGNVIPKFLWYGNANGTFRIACQNMETLQFLKSAVYRFGELWKGARLQVVDKTRSIKATVWIPGRLDNPETIIQRIGRQNDINVTKWQILSFNQKPSSGQQLVLGIDDASAEIIKRACGLVNCGLSVVTVILEYHTGTCDSEDTENDINRPSTSTNELW